MNFSQSTEKVRRLITHMSHCLKLFTLGSAFWLIGDMILDGIQASKYYHLSPFLNQEHEANQNLNERILIFCANFQEINFNTSVINELEIKLLNEWIERCQTRNFNFSISFGLFGGQVEHAKVS